MAGRHEMYRYMENHMPYSSPLFSFAFWVLLLVLKCRESASGAGENFLSASVFHSIFSASLNSNQCTVATLVLTEDIWILFTRIPDFQLQEFTSTLWFHCRIPFWFQETGRLGARALNLESEPRKQLLTTIFSCVTWDEPFVITIL